VYHSGLDEFGVPTAEYFPVDGEMLVDVDNKPVTGMVRQYDRLIVTKRDSTYQIGYDTLTDALGRARAAFYLLPVNGVVGSEAPGQACLVLNDPVMPHNGALYELRASQVRDERNMRDVSERVAPLLAEMDLSKVLLCDHERETELLIYQDGRAAVWNYGKDLWYEWDNLPMTCLISWDDRLFFGTNDGRICEISNQYRNNDKIPIISRWESGAMDFGMMDRFKYSKHLFVTVKPASQGRLVVTVETNRGPAEAPLTVTTTVMTFAHANFRHWNFGVNRRAQVEKIRLKARKFSTYKLIFSNDTEQSGSAATVLAVSIEVQTCGQEAKRL
jgi:hypothetical protein